MDWFAVLFGGLGFIRYCRVPGVWIFGFIIIEGRRWGMGCFLYWPWYDSVMFSGGAFLCCGLGIVCKRKAAFRAINGRDQWWYAPGKAGCLNLGMAVSLDWDWFI